MAKKNSNKKTIRKLVKKPVRKASQKPQIKPEKALQKPAKKQLKKAKEVKTIKVRSEAYGTHDRAARGTYTPATLNSSLQKNAEIAGEVNAMAKLFKDTFDPYRKALPDGTMWSRLLSIVKKHAARIHPYKFEGLINFEFDDKQQLNTLFETTRDTKVIAGDQQELVIDVSLRRKFDTKRERVDGYRIVMFVAFLCVPSPEIKSESFVGPMKADDTLRVSFRCVVPEGNMIAIVAIKGEYMTGEVQTNRRFGMKVLEVLSIQNAKIAIDISQKSIL